MPPAFNLSQDQTLQFDLKFLKSLDFHSLTDLKCFTTFTVHERLVLRPGILRCPPQSSNAHAYRLYVVNVPAKRFFFLQTPLRSAEPRIMTGFFISRQV